MPRSLRSLDIPHLNVRKLIMKTLFKILTFVLIWGFTFGATYLVWKNFGALIGILFFLFGAGLAGALGMFISVSIARICGIKMEE